MTKQGLNYVDQQCAEHILSLWGMWEFSGREKRGQLNLIARLMQSVNGTALRSRELCDDELGGLLHHIVSEWIMHSPTDYQYLEQRYVFGLSRHRIAKWAWESAKAEYLRGEWRVPSLKTFERRVNESLDTSAWLVLKVVRSVTKMQQNAVKWQKLTFLS